MENPSYEILKELSNLNKTDSDYRQNRMKLMVKYLSRYMETYDKQVGYQNYSDQTLVEDVLYGLGVVLNPHQHKYADGFTKWRNKLKNFLITRKIIQEA